MVKCQCGHSAPLKTFRFVSWQTFSEPNKKGKLGSVISGYYYCVCQDGLPLPEDKARTNQKTARPIAYRQGGNNRWPRIVLSFPDEATITEPEQVETLQLAGSL